MRFSLTNILFVFEILCTEFFFVHSFERREHFALRAVISVALCLVLAAFFPNDIFSVHTFGAAIMNFFKYFLLFSFTVLVIKVCYSANFWTILSASTAGYALQQTVQRMFVIISIFIIPFSDIESPYNVVFTELLCIGIVTPLYLISYFTFGRHISEKYYKNEDGNDVKLKGIAIGAMLILMLVTRIQDFEDLSPTATLATSVYSIICCLFILLLNSSVLQSNSKQKELEFTRYLYAKEQEKYRSWQDSIEVVNIKCHDLKQQIAELRKNRNEDYMSEIEESVMIYDNALKTGNDVLDVILFEKTVYCEKNGIDFEYLVDGKALDFMPKFELYTFFTNMLNNALDALAKVEPEKRVIQLKVKSFPNMLVIKEENYYSGTIEVENGLPKTQKEDKDNHGYGMKSMKRFVEKYGGTLDFTANGEIFSLNICIPTKRTNAPL